MQGTRSHDAIVTSTMHWTYTFPHALGSVLPKIIIQQYLGNTKYYKKLMKPSH